MRVDLLTVEVEETADLVVVQNVDQLRECVKVLYRKMVRSRFTYWLVQSCASIPHCLGS